MELNQKQILSAESLTYLGIDTMFCRNSDGTTVILEPLYIEPRSLSVLAGGTLESARRLCITMKTGNEYVIKIRTEKIRDELFTECWNIILLETLPFDLTDKIIYLNKIDTESGRRAEERYEITTANAKKFGMKNAFCSIAAGIETIRCVLLNASVHGVLIAGERARIAQGSPVMFHCSFLSGYVAQNAAVVTIRSARNSGDYYSYALHFTEPVSFVWKQKILAYRSIL